MAFFGDSDVTDCTTRRSLKAMILNRQFWLAVALGMMAHFAARASFAQASHGRKPLTVTYVQHDPDGSVFSHYTVAYRADGSEAGFTALASDNHPPVREIWDLKNGYNIMIDPVTRLWTRVPLPRDRIEARSHVPTSCEQAFGAAYKVSFVCVPSDERQFGRAVYIGKLVTYDPRNKSLFYETSFTADPSLDWLMLQRERVTDGTNGSMVKAVSLAIGEPDPALFTVPEDFQHMAKVSDFLQLSYRARGNRLWGEEVYTRIDKRQAEAEAIGPFGSRK
jgi:hypothetical protein